MHYTGTIWRPPYEAESLLLQATAGCTHHNCKFCTLYHDLPFPFRMSPMEEVEADIEEAAPAGKLFGWKRVFLTGANPFVLKPERLLAIAGQIHQKLPAVQTIGCFARITDIALKTGDELEQLRRMGYDGLTIGMETGDEEALRFMRKGYGAADILEQAKRLEQAGISYRVFYLTGISGAGRGQEGARRTAEVLNQLQPVGVGANMLTVYRNSDLYQDILRGAWQEEEELEKYRELYTLVEGLTIPVEFMALGASNAFQLQGVLPEERDALLRTLNQIITQGSEETLRTYREQLPHL
ncbi:MAG: radical SAM protein [Eubacteriales bacterium]|nr:radical SAM protein [Eubacteriales bacterium]